MIQSPVRHKFTVEELYRIEELLQPEQRMELVCGEIIDMRRGAAPPINPPHAICVNKLNWLFYGNLSREQYLVSSQNPLLLSGHSLVQPDLVVSHLQPGLLENEHIKGEDVVLLIEVSDSSYRYDREDKYKLYASAGIPVYVIVNLNQRKAEIYTQPEGNRYTQEKTTDVSFAVLALEIRLSDILPKA